ncbi:MAG: divalent metal cation transporter, partial [Gemmatimonadota bacterium]|nr:divalent metal cation transporter [Gemmatimonadota bacterium]
LTQTAVFTERLGASFAFAIVVSILVDLVAQLNIWRVLTVSGRRAQQVANEVLPGLGWALALLVAAGGMAFNIGNIAGTGLGLNALAGIDVRLGATASAVVAIGLFIVREAGRAMDRFAQVLGLLMIGLTAYVVVVARPPLGEAALRTVVPLETDPLSIVTIVGGTVGGYITFAGAHRLLDAGVIGRSALGRVTRTAFAGIGIASLMRILLFLATLGVVAHGATLDAANPPASAFAHAAGELGARFFGAVMWAAAITSVVGAAYTSVSFLRSVSTHVERAPSRAIIVFIVISTAIFLAVGRPVAVLVLVGAINGLILPVSLGTMLIAAHRRRIVGDYRHPLLLTLAGIVVAAAMAMLGMRALLTVDF